MVKYPIKWEYSSVVALCTATVNKLSAKQYSKEWVCIAATKKLLWWYNALSLKGDYECLHDEVQNRIHGI